MQFITPLFAYGTVALDIALVVVFLAFLSRRTWGKGIIDQIGAHAVILGLLVSLVAVVGSLIYSNIIGYAPCELCWWQRICLYPLVLLFTVALYKRYREVYDYALPLAGLAGVIALYHAYIQLGGTTSILPCTASGAACTKVYVLSLGYVTIPTMSLTIALSIILLAFIKKSHDKNRNA